MLQLSRRRFLEAVGLTAIAPAVDLASAQTAVPASPAAIAVEKNVVFGKGGQLDMRLDIYKPRPGTEKRTATIHLHGGGFTGGNKEQLNERILPYARAGYTAISADYRLTAQGSWPAMIEDVKAAIRWTRANASRLAIDPAHIIVVGYSAGGYLALTAAGTPNRTEFEGTGGNAGVPTQVAACVAYYAVTDKGPPPSAAAATYVSASYPPTILFHGVADTTVPIESSQRFFQLLRDAKVTSEFHSFAGVAHVFDSQPDLAQVCGQLADVFIDRHVLNPRPTPTA
jgi:acetyl esterase/lipase